MTEQKFAEFLKEAIESYEDGEPREAVSFEDNGIMSRNVGLVVAAEDGSEFQITIIRSREADNDADELD